MIISNTLTLSDGSTASNVFMLILLHTGTIESNGKAPTDLMYWRSEVDMNAGKTRIYPIVDGRKISSVTPQFTGQEIVKVGPNCTVAEANAFYKQAVINKLNADYGWNIIQ